jgi:Tol biopolymer transport system component/imidazolonepropionase-like amidohydrolase
MFFKIQLIIGLLILQMQLFAQDQQPSWNVNEPLSPFKQVDFTVDEGTWMNLDVSPDGSTIIFDMLGDIYTMPVKGGKASLLQGGHAFEIQPRFSPDGNKIVYTSDRGGGDNIWIMDKDGSNAFQLTKEAYRLLNNPVWTTDGNFIVARKHFTSQRSMGAGEMWMYHKAGGKGIQLTKRKNDQMDAGEPCASPDGKYIYYSEDMSSGERFEYNKDPNSQIYMIRRYNMEDGKVENVIQGPGGAIRPQVSPDGSKLAFIRRVREKSVLFIHDLATGIQNPVYDDLSKDQQEAWAIFGVYTNFNWLPDNENLIIWSKGKIRKINTKTGAASIIPFEVDASHQITEALNFKQDPAPDYFDAKVIRHAKTSPDGKYLAFNAVGCIWIKTLPDGKPRRLTKSKDFEFEPSFSPDGKHIIYVSWNDEEKGSIRKISVAGGNFDILTKEKGIYRTPSFAPDGKTIVYYKESGNRAMGFAYGVNPGIYTMKPAGSAATFITNDGQNPVFSADGKRIYYQKGGFLFGSLDKSYRSVNPDGKDQITHVQAKFANQFTLSPDNQWLAFSELYYIYIIPFPDHGNTLELSGKLETLPIAKVSNRSGINLQWSGDGQKLHWTTGKDYNTVEISNCFSFLENAPDSIGTIESKITDIGLELDADIPQGLIAFTNAKIITMDENQIIENGTVVVKNNRIMELGNSNDVKIPSKSKVIDLKGKVLMPGFIDTHAHLNAFRYGLSPQKDWPYYANLAYGITSTHDPSSNSEMSLSQSEMIKAGHMVGPRVFTTGTILYGAEGDFKAVINNFEDAKFAIERTKAYGAFSVKSYNQPRREQRQQVIKAAKELGIMVYPEGGSTFFHNMTMILDGHTSIEHNIPVAPLYDDVLQLWSASKTANTPTLIVNYGSLNGELYWYQHTNVWENEKLLKYTPRSIIDSRSRHRKMAPEEEYENGHILTSKSCKKLVDKGVHICVGGHGQLQGLGVLWEMWNLSQGGMTNMEVLRAATIHGAEYIGMEEHLGSIKKGKLADLIILEKDPVQDILNIDSVIFTMVNGRLYETATMNETGNYNDQRSKFFWELEGHNENFEWHESTNSFQAQKCTCGH